MSKHTIITYFGPGWKEIYEVLPDGKKKLLWSTSDKKEDLNTATEMSISETLTWEDFCRKYRNDPQYA